MSSVSVGSLSGHCRISVGSHSGIERAPKARVDCGIPADVVGASRLYPDGTTEGRSATYTCWDKYTWFWYGKARTCSVSDGTWSPYPLVCSGLLNLTTVFSTSQSSTKPRDQYGSYTSQNAVDGTSSYSSTQHEPNPTWTLSFGSQLFDIFRVNVDMPSVAFDGPNVNVTVDVIRSSDARDNFRCTSVGLQTLPVFRVTCKVSTHGHEIRISAQYLRDGPLVIRSVRVLGRERRSGCDRPRPEVGKRFVYNGTHWRSTMTEYCEKTAGFYYGGGSNTGTCSLSDSRWAQGSTICENYENVAKNKKVIFNTTDTVIDVMNVVDGDVNSCAKTPTATEHTLVVDLGQLYDIKRVTASILETGL
ncbi:uncharacterized protein LOC121388344 [Gigantopelta aegis]|uniref:uncharacterized protein LOC121388344 n=1 Tax=Gigantopelta aegis TaxID=1735272 RepID=UPI001B88B47A|nr:uncharacterized protein LOC121388344 [Gigantopelta aegis]